VSNVYRALLDLLPAPALLIGEVLAVHADNTSTVELPDGTQLRVRGGIVAVGQPAFVHHGVIEGLAPAMVATVIEI